jgi:hypothetical protein
MIVWAGIFTSCNEDENNTLSKAVLASASTLNFDSQAAAEKIITVYADADWVSEVPDWVKITPTTGTGTMDVTISVDDNLRDGLIDNPRKENVVFKGCTLASRAEVVIVQNGDKYRDCKEYEMNEITPLDDEAVVSITSATVVAVTTRGFIASDMTNSANIYMTSPVIVKVGDKIAIKGTKLTDSQKLSYIQCDVVTVSASATITYPAATDITSKIDTYSSITRDYITVSGQLNGNSVVVEDAKNTLLITDAPESMRLDALNGHNVKVTGYFAGTAAPVVRIIATTIEDKGVAEVIYFSDDFEWLKPWATNSGAGKTVENDGDGSAPQIYNAKDKAGTTADAALLEHGYGLEEVPGHAIYLQDCYLKFGKTDYQGGITLPSVETIPAGENVTLSFDWAPMVGSTRKFDPVEVVVTVTNGDNVVELTPQTHSFENEVSTLLWLHADIKLDGIGIDKDTRISIKSNRWGESSSNNGGTNVYLRWFIDNIKLTKSK